ncbi:MAG: LacI family DNA-binding transcriptional regulator, partial [Phycisphaerae bacterium]
LQSALQAALRAADMHMLIANAATDLMADGSLYAVVEGMAEAIIGEVHDPDIVQRLAAHCPVVLLNSEVRCDNVDAVIPDLERALRRQIDFLVRVGHRRVACFRPRPSSRWGDRRLWQEYEDSSNRLGLAVPKEYLEPIQFGWDEHPHAINEFLERVIRPDIQPTAILTYDVYAGELIHQLAQRGLTVPKDISIVGFDDNTYGRFCPVPLTTFRQDFEEMAQTAVELLKRRLKEPSRAARVVEIAGQLVERKSTAPVGKTQADVDMGSTRQGKGNDL